MTASRCIIAMLMVLATATVAPGAIGASAGTRIPERPEIKPAETTGGEPRVLLAPIRFEPKSAKPGTELRYAIRVTNTTDRPVPLQAVAIPLDGSKDPDRFAEPGSSTSRSADAVAWVSFPGFERRLELGPDMQVTFPASVRIPSDARPGTYSLGVGVAQSVSAPATNVADSPTTQVRLRAVLPSVVVVRVPGEANSEVRLRDIESPRLVFSGDRPTFRVRVTNSGDTDLRVDGKVDLSSFLSSAGRTLNAKGPEKGFETLPGGTRELVMRWTDPPLLGWFRPELVVVGGKGSNVRVTDNLDTVYVLPPWWLILLLLVAVWLPVRSWRRRRGDDGWNERRRARARQRVDGRLRKQEAMRRARDARRR